VTTPLTHLDAFCSDDAKLGRVWTDGENEWRRTRDDLEARPHGSFWRKWGAQVAAIPGEVTWADGPKTLTPSELTIKAALMLRDEARMLQGEAEKKLGAIAAAVAFRGCDCDCGCDGDGHGDSCDPCLACEVSRIISPPKFTGPSALRNDVPDPSQPAEPLSIYEARRQERRAAAGLGKAEPTKPPLKVGDRVKLGSQHGNVVWSGLGRVHVEFDGVGAPTAHDQYDIEKIEAEPQVEYPLTYAEAMWAMECGSHVSSERWPGNVYHKDYSFLAFDTDEVKSSWRIVEPATGGEG